MLTSPNLAHHWLRCLLLLLCLAAWCNSSSAAQQRVALVIGNAAYDAKPLRNPVNDAELMQRTLRDLGFDVTLLRNADRRALLGGLRDFEAKARNAEVALFFYAGHGTQVGGSNYLIPLHAQIRAESDVPDEAVDASSVLRRIEDAKARVGLVILDACRDTPYAGASRSSSRGLARMSVPTGSIVAYATAPGDTADDGKGTNGVYTEQLVRHLSQSGLDLREVFDRTATEVERITNGKQKPREDVGLRGRFVLKDGAGVQVASVRAEPVAGRVTGGATAEAALWAEVTKNNIAEDYEAYLAQYPKGTYVALAKGRLKKLQDEQAAENERKLQAERAAAARQETELWQRAQASNQSSVVQTYLNQVPDGPNTMQARTRLAELQQVETAEQNRLREINIKQEKERQSRRQLVGSWWNQSAYRPPTFFDRITVTTLTFSEDGMLTETYDHYMYGKCVALRRYTISENTYSVPSFTGPCYTSTVTLPADTVIWTVSNNLLSVTNSTGLTTIHTKNN